MAELTVRSDQFDEDGPIPPSAAHPSAGGEDKSPHLAWEGLPVGTKSVALTCWDPDAPTTVGFCHWVATGIPPSVTELAEGAGTEEGEWAYGISDWGEARYGGMAPPEGDPPHHYRFTVYALDATADTLGLDEHTTYAKLRFLVKDHVLATGTLTGTFAASG